MEPRILTIKPAAARRCVSVLPTTIILESEATLFPVCRFDLSRIYRGREEGYAAPLFSTSVFESLPKCAELGEPTRLGTFCPGGVIAGLLKLYYSQYCFFESNNLTACCGLMPSSDVLTATLPRSWRKATNSNTGHTQKEIARNTKNSHSWRLWGEKIARPCRVEKREWATGLVSCARYLCS